MSRQINYDMKVLYAFGIVFVAAGHCSYGGVSLGYDWFLPHAFHLGLFMFISGYFYEDGSKEHILSYIGRKAKKLLLPLYLWNVFYAFFVLLTKQFGFTLGEAPSLYNLLVMPWTDGHQFMYNMGGWFVPSLFLAHTVNVLLRKLLSMIKCENDWLVEGIYLAVGMTGMYLSMQGAREGLYLMMLRLFYFLPFYGMGTLYRRKLEGRLHASGLIYFTVIMTVQLMLITINNGNVAYYPAWCSNFNGILQPFVAGMCGIFFWLGIAGILSPVIGRSRYVLALSEHGYSIMINQMLGFFTVKTFFALANKYLHVFGSFSWESYFSDMWYYYLPRGIQQWLIIYLIAGIIIPIGMDCIIKRLLAYCRCHVRPNRV